MNKNKQYVKNYRKVNKRKTVSRSELMFALLDNTLDSDLSKSISKMYTCISLQERNTGKYISNIPIEESDIAIYNYIKNHPFITT